MSAHVHPWKMSAADDIRETNIPTPKMREPIPDWMVADTIGSPTGGRFDISTLEGVMIAEMGDVIIRGVKGEVYPCKPDIFAATYEVLS